MGVEKNANCVCSSIVGRVVQASLLPPVNSICYFCQILSCLLSLLASTSSNSVSSVGFHDFHIFNPFLMFGSAPASKRSLTVSRCPYWARSIKYWAGREFDHSALLHNGQSLTESLGLSLCHFSTFTFSIITSRSNKWPSNVFT